MELYIGQTLKKFRKARNLTQEEVAKAIGISVSALSSYECGDRMPRDHIKIEIAHYYNKSVEEIFFAN